MPELPFPSHPLASATLLRVTMRLVCGCGFVTEQSFEGTAIGTGRGYTCSGCSSSHWFTIGEDGGDA